MSKISKFLKSCFILSTFLAFIPAFLATEFGGEQGWYEENAANEGDLSDALGQKISFEPGEAFQVATAAAGDATISFASAFPVAE